MSYTDQFTVRINYGNLKYTTHHDNRSFMKDYSLTFYISYIHEQYGATAYMRNTMNSTQS